MKTTFFLLVAALLCGCNQKPDPRIAKLDERITALETNFAGMQDRAEDFNRILTQYMQQGNTQAKVLTDFIHDNTEQMNLLRDNLLVLDTNVDLMQRVIQPRRR